MVPFRIDILIGKNGELYTEGGLEKGRVVYTSEAGMWAMAVNSHIWFHVHGRVERREGKQRNSSPPFHPLPLAVLYSIFLPTSLSRLSNALFTYLRHEQ